MTPSSQERIEPQTWDALLAAFLMTDVESDVGVKRHMLRHKRLCGL